LIDLAQTYVEEHGIGPASGRPAVLALPERERIEHFGRWAVAHFVEQQRRVLRDYGVEFDMWTSEQQDVRARHLPERALEELAGRGLTHEQDGALWFRSPEFGDDKDRVLRRTSGEPTYFAVDLAHHHYLKFPGSDRVINLFGPDHHGLIPRLKGALQALGHPPEAFEILIVQLVRLLRDGQPVRMSKRRGEFVLMEELLEEVGRDAARFTFLTRRHDSPLDFDLGVATRQSSENPVYYVQYAHARVRSIWRQVAEQGIEVPSWSDVDFGVLTRPEELTLMKRLVGWPDLLAGAARALEAHRVAYWLSELAGLFHPYYKAHRVIQPDRGLMLARLALATAVGQVIRNGLALLGVSAPESM
jgi:arginyl-tRNA synthetase